MWFILMALLFISDANASKFSQCATYLRAVGYHNSNPYVANETTKVAVQKLTDFKRSELFGLPESDYAGSVIASANSYLGVKGRLAGRVSQLLDDIRTVPETEMVFYSSITYGEMRTELMRRRAYRRTYDRLAHEWAPWYLVSGISYPIFMGALIIASFYDPLWSIPTALVGVLTRFIPEEILRGLSFWQILSDETAISVDLMRLSPGQWFYRSFNMTVPTAIVPRIMHQPIGADAFREFDEFRNDYIAPTLTQQMTSRHWLLPWDKSVSSSRGYLMIDELLKWEKGLKPELITLVRIYRDKNPSRGESPTLTDQ